MPTYPILPSLSRAPSFDSQRSAEDGTVADPMESGYVSTRPRFTRLRRKFSVTYKFLSDEDVRALDKFEVLTVKGKAGAFYLPNLLANGSFEIQAKPGSGQFADGWSIIPGSPDPYQIFLSSTADDGSVAAGFTLRAVTIAAGVEVESAAACERKLQVGAGDVLGLAVRVSAANTVATPEAAALVGRLAISYADGTIQTVDQTIASTATSGYTSASATYTVPVAGSGAPVSAARFALIGKLTNGGTESYTATAGAATFLVDSLGLTVTTAAQPYGRIPGSAPSGTPVRFTKTPEHRDAGWADGAKRYDVTFEVTEL